MAASHADPPDGSTERFVPVGRRMPPDGGVLAAAFCTGVAVLWIATCIWLLSLALFNRPSLASVAACLFGMALGVLALASQLPQLALAVWFRHPKGSVLKREAHDGETYVFRYSQRTWKPTTAKLTCSLVLREWRERTMPDGEPAPATWIDHLVASHRSSSAAAHPGDLLRAQSVFWIPPSLAQRFALRGGKVSWLVKVRVQLPDQRDFWEEFELPAVPNVDRHVPAADLSKPTSRYTVVVLWLPDWFRPEPTPEALLEVAPHLHAIGRLPVRALETLSRSEAERACRRLEAAGIRVALYCDDRIVARNTLHDLPIPPENTVASTHELPIPVAEGEELAAAPPPAIQPFSQANEAPSQGVRLAS